LLFIPQSSHRVAMVTFWRTFHHDGKISPDWRGREVHALPLSLYLLVLVCSGSEDRYCSLPLFLLYPYSYSVFHTILIWCDVSFMYPIPGSHGCVSCKPGESLVWLTVIILIIIWQGVDNEQRPICRSKPVPIRATGGDFNPRRQRIVITEWVRGDGYSISVVRVYIVGHLNL
jgi:hypothetical protein